METRETANVPIQCLLFLEKGWEGGDVIENHLFLWVFSLWGFTFDVFFGGWPLDYGGLFPGSCSLEVDPWRLTLGGWPSEVDPWRLTLEAWRLEVDPWRLTDPPQLCSSYPACPSNPQSSLCLSVSLLSNSPLNNWAIRKCLLDSEKYSCVTDQYLAPPTILASGPESYVVNWFFPSSECWKQNQLDFGAQRSLKLQYFWHCLLFHHYSISLLLVGKTHLRSEWMVATKEDKLQKKCRLFKVRSMKIHWSSQIAFDFKQTCRILLFAQKSG